MIAQKAARMVADIVYREIDVRVHPQVTFDRPTICVANHFGGLSDAILVVDTLPVMPRIVARDVIWRIPIAGQIMRGVGAIPVHRRADGPAPESGAEVEAGHAGSKPAQPIANDDMFSSCFSALAEGATILIFPEGVTQEDPHIAPIKTGAARIALGAARRGVPGLQVVPVGVHYEDKAGFRNSALVNIGAPLSISDWLAEHPGDEPQQVRALTVDIELALRAAAPDYPDWQTCRDLELAAEVMLHDVDAGSLPVRYGDRSLIADHLAARAGISAGASAQTPDGPTRGRGLLEAVGSYRMQMNGLRVGDLAIRRVGGSGAPRSERSWIGSLLLILLLGPYALVGLAMVALPWLLVKLTRLARLAPAVQASVTPAMVILVFGLQWLSILWRGWENDGLTGIFIGLVLPPFFVAVAVFVVERFVLLARRLTVRALRPSAKVAAAQQAREAVGNAAWELA